MSEPALPCGPGELTAWFGDIDIYLFDQLLRGRITPRMRILDAGCGAGRNIHYLLRCGAEVHGIDGDARQIDRIRALAAQLAPAVPPENFIAGSLTALPFADDYFAAVICSAVLHFARDQPEFEAMVAEMWRVLDRGGIFFARLASTIGIESHVRRLADRRYHLPDGSERFLVDQDYLLRITSSLNGELLDPLKTTNVQNVRAMTTWVVRKAGR